MERGDAKRETYPVEIGAIHRELPLFEVAPGVTIAVFNMLGDVEAVEAAATALAERMPAEAEVLITPEAKSIPLAHALAVRTGLPHVVLRKKIKAYMGEVITAETRSITTGSLQTLHLDEKDRRLVHGHGAILLDDVVSSGSTLIAMRSILEQTGGREVGVMAVFTEGDAERWKDVIALGHLPVKVDDAPS